MVLHLGTVCSRKGQVFSATACAKLIQDLAWNDRVVRIILYASYITSHTPRLTVCTIYLHWGIHIICWVLGAFVCNKHTLFYVTVLLPCKTHVITVRRTVARIWSSSSWVPDIFVIMKSNTSTKSLRFGRVSRIVDVVDGSPLVIDGFFWNVFFYWYLFLVAHSFALAFDSSCWRGLAVLFAGRGWGGRSSFLIGGRTWRFWGWLVSNVGRNQDVARLKRDLRWILDMTDWLMDWYGWQVIRTTRNLPKGIARISPCSARVVRWLVPTRSRAVAGKSWVTVKKASLRLPSWISKRHLCFNKKKSPNFWERSWDSSVVVVVHLWWIKGLRQKMAIFQG